MVANHHKYIWLLIDTSQCDIESVDDSPEVMPWLSFKASVGRFFCPNYSLRIPFQLNKCNLGAYQRMHPSTKPTPIERPPAEEITMRIHQNLVALEELKEH